MVRRECWTISWWGKVGVLFVLAVLGYGGLRSIHPFLTVSDGGRGEVMVVEGWIGPRRLQEATDAFGSGKYWYVVVVRDVHEDGDKWASGRYKADYVAKYLVDHGVPEDRVHLIFCPVVKRDRTFQCAVAVKDWLQKRGNSPVRVDVATIAAHTRRSRLLYEKAFGPGVAIGAIPLGEPSYDPSCWWRSSDGVREVPFELLAYLYVRLFFTPPPAADPVSSLQSSEVSNR